MVPLVTRAAGAVQSGSNLRTRCGRHRCRCARIKRQSTHLPSPPTAPALPSWPPPSRTAAAAPSPRHRPPRPPPLRHPSSARLRRQPPAPIAAMAVAGTPCPAVRGSSRELTGWKKRGTRPNRTRRRPGIGRGCRWLLAGAWVCRHRSCSGCPGRRGAAVRRAHGPGRCCTYRDNWQKGVGCTVVVAATLAVPDQQDTGTKSSTGINHPSSPPGCVPRRGSNHRPSRFWHPCHTWYTQYTSTQLSTSRIPVQYPPQHEVVQRQHALLQLPQRRAGRSRAAGPVHIQRLQAVAQRVVAHRGGGTCEATQAGQLRLARGDGKQTSTWAAPWLVKGRTDYRYPEREGWRTHGATPHLRRAG